MINQLSVETVTINKKNKPVNYNKFTFGINEIVLVVYCCIVLNTISQIKQLYLQLFGIKTKNKRRAEIKLQFFLCCCLQTNLIILY